MSFARSQHARQRQAAARAATASQRRQALRLAAAAGAALVCAWVFPGRAAAPQQASDPKTFIDDLGSEVMAIIKAPNLSRPQREERFRTLFSSRFDVPTIARFVVGRYWNRASNEEQQKYLDTFGNYVAAIYAEQFSHYQGERFTTVGARSLGDSESVVRSQIERPGQAPINVEFRVKRQAGSFKIDDVTVENVSLIITKRDEFSSLLSQGGLKGVTERMQSILKNTQHTGA